METGWYLYLASYCRQQSERALVVLVKLLGYTSDFTALGIRKGIGSSRFASFLVLPLFNDRDMLGDCGVLPLRLQTVVSIELPEEIHGVLFALASRKKSAD